MRALGVAAIPIQETDEEGEGPLGIPAEGGEECL